MNEEEEQPELVATVLPLLDTLGLPLAVLDTEVVLQVVGEIVLVVVTEVVLQVVGEIVLVAVTVLERQRVEV